MPNDKRDDVSIRGLATYEPGKRPEDLYDKLDVMDLPKWWEEAVREFNAYDLRPYQPPRFVDGNLKHVAVQELESELGVSITFIGINVAYEDDWAVQIDGEPIGEIGRHRSPDGYTVFEMERDEFVKFVRAAVEEE